MKSRYSWIQKLNVKSTINGMASPTSMARRVGESSEYPLRDSLLIYNPRRRKMKLPGRVETWELLVNCLVDREDFAEKTELD